MSWFLVYYTRQQTIRVEMKKDDIITLTVKNAQSNTRSQTLAYSWISTLFIYTGFILSSLKRWGNPWETKLALSVTCGGVNIGHSQQGEEEKKHAS